MITLLTYKTIRLLNIAEAILIQNRNIKLSEIAEMNDCSLKTVKDDLIFLHENWNEILELVFDHNTISSTNTSCFDFMIMKRELYKEEIKLQMIVSMFLFPNLKLEEYADKLNYSESHLRKQIKPINQFLKNYEITVDYNHKTFRYHLKSNNSLQQAYFISQILKESSNISTLSQLKNIEKEYYENQIQLIPSFFVNQTKEDLETLYKVMKYAHSNNEPFQEAMHTINQTYHNLKSNEQHFIKELKSHYQSLNTTLNQKQVKKALDIHLLISTKATLFPIKVDQYWNRYDFFYEAHSNEHKDLNQSFSNFIIQTSHNQHLNYTPYKSEFAFNLYTTIPIHERKQTFRIAIHSDLGPAHVNTLAHTYQKHFSNHTIEPYTIEKSYDLILSTQSLSDEVNKYKIIKISDRFTFTDVKKIHRFLKLN